MPEGKLSSSPPSETQNLDEQTIPPEVEIEKRSFVGQVVDKIKIHQKKILLGLALFLVILAVLGVANRVYWLSKWWFRSALPPTPTPSLISTPTPNPMADWQTYTNLEYGYLIRYPSDWNLQPDKQTPEEIINLEKNFNSLSIYSGSAIPKVPQIEPSRKERLTIGGQEATKEAYKDLFELIIFPEGLETNHITLRYKDGLYNEEYAKTFGLILSTFKFLSSEEKQISFRIDEEGDITKVILIDKDGQERVLREYRWPETGRARRLDVSPNNKFLAVSHGTAHLGSLEIINLENEETVTVLSEYGQVIWFDDHRLVLNAPETVDPPRPYEGGEGVSLVAFDAVSNKQRLLKKADAITDYPLQRVENEEIFFEKRVVKEGNDWTNPKISYWKINFEGTVEMEVE